MKYNSHNAPCQIEDFSIHVREKKKSCFEKLQHALKNKNVSYSLDFVIFLYANTLLALQEN
jgi:hypothetical protein